MRRALRQIRARLAAGLLTALPFVVTVWLLGFLFRLVDRVLTARSLRLLELIGSAGALPVWSIRLASVLVVMLALYLLGIAATHVAGRQLLRLVEWLLARVPLLGGVYRTLRQVADAVGTGASSAFRRCVLIEYPRRGLWTMAFVTNERRVTAGAAGEPLVPVFLPTTPNPTSGYFLLVPESECRPLDIPVEEGVKLVVSGGILLPPLREGPEERP
ncbi:MAG: DUF502 domain-containing protein [Acidobacteria bacterium]|nr:MAG: DUF502 domain-containing protein [Acidobacteriota bacterium]